MRRFWSIVSVLAKLELRDVTLVGESIGGVLALTVSVDQPEGAALFTIEQAGHFTSLEKPAQVAALILGQSRS